MATANPRSVVAFLDGPFSDPFMDDGRDDEVPVIDLDGHAHYTSTSKGLRSALAQGKKDIDGTRCPVYFLNHVWTDPYDGGTGGMDLLLKGSGRVAAWARGGGYTGPCLTGDIQMRCGIERIALDNGGCSEPFIQFTDYWQESIKDLFMYNGRGYAVILGGKGLQCASMYSVKAGSGASLKLVGASQITLYSPMLERGFGSNPALLATAGVSVSGPFTIVDGHCERDDLLQAFVLDGFDVVEVSKTYLHVCRGLFRNCTRIIDVPNYRKGGGGFDYVNCSYIASYNRPPVPNYVDPNP